MSNVVDEQIVETNDELEILLDRLNRLQKSIAGVDAAFNVDSLIQYSEKIMGTASTVNILSGALGGNKVALAEMQKEMPMTYQSLQTLEKSFRNFRFGIENGNYMTGLTEGFKVLQNNMNRVQKGLVGVSAGFTELSSVKNSVSDMITETDSLAGNIAEMSVSVIGAGAAFSSVFGFPAGVVVSGIMGVIGAIAGIGEAFEEIEAEKFGESVKNALSNPGGVPIEELTNSVVNSIVSIGDKFSVITEKSQELDMAEKNIQDIWLEIETIQTKMDAGVMSVEEGSTELVRLFGKLALETQEKFAAIEQSFVATYGENGFMTQTMNRLGVSTENTTTTIVQLYDNVGKRIIELNNLLENTDPNTPEYAQYKKELAMLSSTTEETSQALNDFSFKMETMKVDYSRLLPDDGTLNTDYLTTILEGISSAVTTTNEEIYVGINSVRRDLEESLNYAIMMNDIPAQEEIRAQLSALPDGLELLKQDVSAKALEFTNAMQEDLFNKIPEIIEMRTAEWNTKSPFEKMYLSLIHGIDSKDEYVKQGVEEYRISYIEPVSLAIETEMVSMGIEGAGWADEATRQMIDSLFDINSEMDYSTGVTTMTTTLKNDWKQIFSDVAGDLDSFMMECGYNTISGYVNGLNEYSMTTADAVTHWMDEYVNAVVQDRLDTHSPSKVMEEFGMNSVLGYNQGIETYAPLTTMTLTAYMNSALSALGEMYGKMYLSGANSMLGIYDGLQSKEVLLYTKAQLIAENIKRIFNGETVVNTEIAVPSMSYADFAPYRSVYEPMDFSGTITSQVEVAVSNAMIPYLEQIANNTKEALNKELSVNIGDREIARANARGQSAMGIQLIK